MNGSQDSIGVGALAIRFLVEPEQSGGAVHGFHKRGSGLARFLAIATPGLMRPTYFHELRAVLTAAAGGSPDPADVEAVMRRYGLTPATLVPTQ